MQNETKQPEPTTATGQTWLRALMLRDPGRWSGRLALAAARLRQMKIGQQRRLRRLAAAGAASVAGLALVAVLAGPMAPPVHAATITVDATCTLIDAIKSANTDTAVGDCEAGFGADTIVLGADLAYTASYASYSGPTALPSITSTVTINGDFGGGTRATLSRGDRAFWLDNLSPRFRLLHVASTGDLTLKNVNLLYGNVGGWDGGAIFVDDNGKLTLEGTTFDSNGAQDEGGAIFADRDSSITMTDSDFRFNYAGGPGAGIYSYGTISGTNVTFDSNFANDDGGAIYISKRDGDVSLMLTYAYFSNNQAAGGEGGAIYANEATVSLTFAEFSGNSAEGGGGAIYAEDGGSLSINYSAFYENSSGFNGGGAIYSHYGTHTTITNTTFISNTTEDNGGAIFIDTVSGSDVGSVKLTHVTITGNSAGVGGGGIYVREGTTHTVTRSIISGNSSPIGAEIYAQGGDSLTSSFNVLGSSATTNEQAFKDFIPSGTDKTATSTGTIPTALSGILDTTQAGEGFYRYLVDGSPAIDIASGATCDVPYDQIGNSRPQGAGCDAGAVEVEPTLSVCPAMDENWVRNGSFERQQFWRFWNDAKNGGRLRYVKTDPFEGQQNIWVRVDKKSKNVQLYNEVMGLYPNTTYCVSITARSNDGRDAALVVHKHKAPFTSYTADKMVMDLTEEWQTFEFEFTSRNINRFVNDARLRLWFAPYAVAGTEYEFDDFKVARKMVDTR